mgnify:CR=1 FL=1
MKPAWLKVPIPAGTAFAELKHLMRSKNLHTVCEEARCPNMAECWNAGTATFMILGNVCTRSCGFCNVKTGRPTWLDRDEPCRVAEAIRTMGIRHAVITSVNRDELPDGGAEMFAETVRRIREYNPGVTVEVLIPDFQGERWALEIVLREKPDILNHNTETVPRLYRTVRPQAKYERSLQVIRWSKEAGMLTKSGIMVGLGETTEEVLCVMEDLRATGCDIMTIGQYLQPTKDHLPVARYVSLEEFSFYRQRGIELGFVQIESGPLVRSSYHAERHASLTTLHHQAR